MCHSIRSSSTNLVSTITDWMGEVQVEGGEVSDGPDRRTGRACSGSGSYRNEETNRQTRTSHVVIKLVAAILSYPPSYVCIPTMRMKQD